MPVPHVGPNAPSLFGTDATAETAIDLPAGLGIVLDYVTAEQGAWIDERLTSAHDAEWLNDLQRRVMHFGYRYDYRSRKVSADSYLGPLPEWAARLADKLVSDGHMPSMPDQMIVNEYLPGQGISAHVDCEPCFGETIVSLSLLSSASMRFRKLRGGDPIVDVLLLPGSLLVMSGEARHAYTHEIAPRKSDISDGILYPRRRRLSLTFRSVVVQKR